jgi:hydrogenase-4 membrane subunit HyfE
VNALIVAFIVVLALPLVAGSWRLAVAGLGAQAIVVFLLMITRTSLPHAETVALLAVDLVLVRGFAAPILLRRAILRASAPAEQFEIIPGDLVLWIAVLGLVILAASFGQRVAPGDPWLAAHLAAAAGEVLVGMLVVAQHRAPLGQVLGMLAIENGVLLFEASGGYHWPVALHLGLAAVFVGLLVAIRYYLLLLPAGSSPEPASDGQEAVL